MRSPSTGSLEVQLDEILMDEWKVKAEDLALELEAIRSEAAKEDSIDRLNIAGMVSVKYYYLLQMFL